MLNPSWLSYRDRRRAGRRRTIAVLLAAGALCIGCAPAHTSDPPNSSAPALPSPSAQTSQPRQAGLVWSDEFDGTLSKWYPDVGANEWTAKRLDGITDQSDNAYIEDGQLVIALRRQSWVDSFGNQRDYTTGRLVTHDAFLYGHVEARINAPVGQGYWAAFWLLGIGDEWPAAGEIDIVELLSDTKDAYVAAHGEKANGEAWDKGTSAQRPDGRPWGDSWHVYAADWSPQGVVFEIDGVEVFRFTPKDVDPNGTFWSFDHPSQIILNLALGAWEGFPGGGQPDATTPFPGELRVDWVRVYDSEISHPRSGG
nr:glycoside hydrolase family 16 protein [Microbacterium bovistercoris]